MLLRCNNMTLVLCELKLCNYDGIQRINRDVEKKKKQITWN